MHVIGQRPKGRNHLAGAEAVPRRPEVGGKEPADGLVNLVGDLLALDVWRSGSVNGRRLFSGRVQAFEDLAAKA